MAIDERELQRVSDELAIRDLVARYCDAVAERDEKAWADTWTDDACWTVGPTHASGRDEVVATWKRLMDLFEFVMQIPSYGTLSLDGDLATGHWTISELGWPRQGEPMATVGLYRDAYRRTDAGWRFSERRFHFVYTGAPDLTGKRYGLPASS